MRRGTMGTRYDVLAGLAAPIDPVEGSSGYFAAPIGEHDPRIFEEGTDRIRPNIRRGILEILYQFWDARYAGAEDWSTVWIAGSALGDQWSGRDGIGDLDILIGVSMPRFRESNPAFTSFGEETIAQHLNAEFREHLHPRMSHWNGFEVTFYVNPGTGDDIRNIRPYAAYNLTTDEWTVRPPELPEDWSEEYIDPAWFEAVDAEHDRARELIARYEKLVTEINGSVAGPRRTNLARDLGIVVDQITALYEDIHANRRLAFQGRFGVQGEGFFDFYNFRWQMFKRSGVGKVLNAIRKLGRESVRIKAEERYGAPIADNVLTPSTLLDL